MLALKKILAFAFKGRPPLIRAPEAYVVLGSSKLTRAIASILSEPRYREAIKDKRKQATSVALLVPGIKKKKKKKKKKKEGKKKKKKKEVV